MKCKKSVMFKVVLLLFPLLSILFFSLQSHQQTAFASTTVQIPYRYGTIDYVQFANEQSRLANYNCHSYVWYYGADDAYIETVATTQLLALMNPSDYFDTTKQDCCVELVFDNQRTSVLTVNMLQVSDIVLYYESTSTTNFGLAHSAIVESVGSSFETTMVRGKNGASTVSSTTLFGCSAYISDPSQSVDSSHYTIGDSQYAGNCIKVYRHKSMHNIASTVVERTSTTHTHGCSFCYRNQRALPHSLSNTPYDADRHYAVCADCNYSGYHYHNNTYQQSTAMQHIVTCLECNYSQLQNHSFVVNNRGLYGCTCGFTTRHPISPNEITETEKD